MIKNPKQILIKNLTKLLYTVRLQYFGLFIGYRVKIILISF